MDKKFLNVNIINFVPLTDLPLITPLLSRVGWSRSAHFTNLKEEEKTYPLFLKIGSSQANIRNMFFYQRSPRYPEVGVLRRHKYKDGHRDSMTNPAQRAESVKIVLNKLESCLFVVVENIT